MLKTSRSDDKVTNPFLSILKFPIWLLTKLSPSKVKGLPEVILNSEFVSVKSKIPAV